MTRDVIAAWLRAWGEPIAAEAADMLETAFAMLVAANEAADRDRAENVALRALLAEVVRADMTPADDDAEVCVYLPVDLWRRLREAVES